MTTPMSPPPQIESEGCDISHNALYSHQIDIAKESEDSEKIILYLPTLSGQ